MKLIIAGGREFEGWIQHAIWLDEIHALHPVTQVISGCAEGADQFGELWAANTGIKVIRFPAKWEIYGISAGPIRNRDMAKYADAVALFPGGRGTSDMRHTALNRGLVIFEYETR